ncbi:MAG TPA: response regulator [Vicinamibacterales bacterium]|nr:response regulator [Vicinamibacterales bacterium]
MAYQLLVMDDSVTIRRVVELTFAGGDVQVVGVGDGRAALERIAAEPPDVILADVGTSQPDGYEVSAYVKGNPALAHIPVLLLSGAFQPIDEERARAAGCDGVLAKPFDPGAVAARVRQVLEERGAKPEPSPPSDEMIAARSADPAAAPDEDADLLAFFEELLAQPLLEGSDDACREEAACRPEPCAPAPLPAPGGQSPFSLDDYFDLLDEILAGGLLRSGPATSPSPSPGGPPRPPRSSSRACSGCPRGSTAS